MESPYYCTICNKNLEIDQEVTTITPGIVWESHVVACDCPDQEILCQRCDRDLDMFLRALAEVRHDPFYKGLVLQQFTTRLVRREAA